MRPRRWLLLTGIAIACLALTGMASASEPAAPTWGNETLDGPTVDTGFLPNGYFVVGTGNAGDTQTVTGQTGQVPMMEPGPCQISGGDADLTLLHEASGCVDALDTSGDETGREGVADLATARTAGRVIVALNPAPQTGGIDENLAAWDLDDGSLTLAYRTQMQGTPLLVETDPGGLRTVVAVQDGNSHRVTELDVAGQRSKTLPTQGAISALAISENSRWAAVGGSTPQGGTTFGYVQLFDLTRARADNPILTQVFQRNSSVVQDVHVANDGSILAASEDGIISAVSQHAPPGILELGDATPTLAADEDANLVFAANETHLVRISGLPTNLAIRWNTTLSSAPTDLILEAPYLYAFGEETAGYSTNGEELWRTLGGTAMATNATGRTLAVASAGSSDTTGTATTSSITVRDLVANATLHQEARPLEPPSTGNQTNQTGNQTNGTNQTDPPTATEPFIPTIAPNATGIVNLTLENTGSAILEGHLAPTNATDAVTIDFLPANFTLAPNKTQTVQASVTIAPGTLPQRIVTGIEPVTTPELNVTAPLTVDVGETPKLSVDLAPGTLERRAVTQGQNLTVHFEIRNTGNTEVSPRVFTTQTPTRGDTWPIQLNPNKNLNIPPGASTSIRMDVQVPNTTPNGTTNQVLISANATNATATTRLTFDVNKFQALQILPESTTKTMAPGQTQTYQYRVTNLGSIPANVTLAANAIVGDGTVVPPGDWGMVLNRSNIRLVDGGSTTFTLELTAPVDLDAQDTLRVRVLAMTSQNVRATATAFGIGDPALADEEQNQEPIHPFLAVAGLAAAAVLTRRLTHEKD